MIDLSPFYGTEPTRPYLHEPFSQGEYTYATNGHILIRVARRDNVPEQSKAPDVNKVLSAAGEKPSSMIPVADKFSFPPIQEEECMDCDGRGTEHDCPDCGCECGNCDGTGRETPMVSMDYRGGILAVKYYLLIASLPNAAMPETIETNKPNWFTFDGGDGLFIAMIRPHESHLTKSDLESGE